MYVDTTCTPSLTSPTNPVNCQAPFTTPSFSSPANPPQPVSYNKPNCSTISTSPNCCSEYGYRTSPYSTQFKKPEKNCHQYKPIDTNFCKPNLTCSIETPVPLPQVTCTATPEVTCTPEVTTTCTEQIDFYETTKVVSGCCTNEPKPYTETSPATASTSCTEPAPATTCVTSACVTPTNETPQADPDIVSAQDGCIYVMNGYGINLMVDGCPSVGYLDTGRDMNFTPGEQVELYQYNGNLNCCSATVQSATDTERKGTNDEILVQVKKVTTCNECRS